MPEARWLDFARRATGKCIRVAPWERRCGSLAEDRHNYSVCFSAGQQCDEFTHGDLYSVNGQSLAIV